MPPLAESELPEIEVPVGLEPSKVTPVDAERPLETPPRGVAAAVGMEASVEIPERVSPGRPLERAPFAPTEGESVAMPTDVGFDNNADVVDIAIPTDVGFDNGAIVVGTGGRDIALVVGFMAIEGTAD